jgi:hypothetical protein
MSLAGSISLSLIYQIPDNNEFVYQRRLPIAIILRLGVNS